MVLENKKETSGIFIYEDPEDFIKAMEYLQELYLASTSEGVVNNE